MTDRYAPIRAHHSEFEPLTDWEASTGRETVSMFDRDYETDPRCAKDRADNLSKRKAIVKEVLVLDRVLGGVLTDAQRSTLGYYERSLSEQLWFAERQVSENSRPKAEAVAASAAQSD